MVIAELRDHPYADATQILVVRNVGQSVARNVVVVFDPPIPDPSADSVHASVIPFIKRRYGRSIPLITPGMELENIWFSGRSTPQGTVNDDPIPDVVVATITSTGPDGTIRSESFELDVTVIQEKTYVTVSTEPRELAKRAVKALEQMAAYPPRA